MEKKRFKEKNPRFERKCCPDLDTKIAKGDGGSTQEEKRPQSGLEKNLVQVRIGIGFKPKLFLKRESELSITREKKEEELEIITRVKENLSPSRKRV